MPVTGSPRVRSRCGAVESGALSRFGNIDPTEGKLVAPQRLPGLRASQRQPRSVGFGHYSRYALRLYSNFTLFSVDAENGDGIEQADDRDLTGFRATYRRRERPALAAF